jgi:hypothetical protein
VHGSLLNESRFFESHVSTIFIDGLKRTAAQFDAEELIEFRNPNALVLKVWGNRAFGDFGDVTTDTALFLGQARTMDFAAGADAGASDATNTCHDEKLVIGGRRMPWVSDASRRNLADFEEKWGFWIWDQISTRNSKVNMGFKSFDHREHRGHGVNCEASSSVSHSFPKSL